MDSSFDVSLQGDNNLAVLLDVQTPDMEFCVEICGVIVEKKLPPWDSVNRYAA